MNGIGKMMGMYSVCFILIVMLFGGIPFEARAADTIKIGVLEALSGPLEFTGRFWLAAVQYAVDEQNAKGGFFGKKIQIITEDSEWKGDVTNRKGKKLIMEDKVDILASGGSAAVAIALNKIATNYKILNISYGATANEVQGSEFSRYAFRVSQNAHNIYAGMALLMGNTSYRKPYLLLPDYVFGYSSGESFKKGLKDYVPDAKIVGEDNIPVGTKDYAPYITKVIAAKADAIVTAMFAQDFINMVRQARTMGLKVPFPFFTHQVEPYPLRDLGDDAVGLYTVTSYDMGVKTPENEEMVKRWHEKHKNDKDFLTWWPFGYCGQTVVGMKMAFAAIEKAGSLDPEKVIPVFEGFQYKSPVGLWTMRKCDHQVLIPMYGGVTRKSGENPYFNGGIRPDVKFPWLGPNLQMLPAEKIAIPATPNYNPRCP